MVRNVRWLAFSFLAVICACATPQRGSGAYVVTPLYRPNAIPVYLGLDGTHFFAHGGDARTSFDLELQQDGCARGASGPDQIEVCPVRESGDSGPARAWRVNGPFGTHTFTIDPRGDSAYVDFGINLGRVEVVLPKQGLLHDHPEMVAAAFLSGAFGRLNPNSETQAYLIEPRRT